MPSKPIFQMMMGCVIVLWLLGCTAQQPQTQSNSVNLGDGGILGQDSACKPPCFWGISPGVTVEADVNQILQSKVSFPCDTFNTEAQGGTRSITCGSQLLITFKQGLDVVSSVGADPSNVITVGDVIQKYGDPNAVLVTLNGTPEEKQRTSMILYFDSIQTTLVLPEQNSLSFKLDATIPIDNIGYHDADSYQNTRQYSSPWNGYGQYEPHSPLGELERS